MRHNRIASIAAKMRAKPLPDCYHEASSPEDNTGSQAFFAIGTTRLGYNRGTAKQKMVGSSAGADSVVMGGWRQPLRLTLYVSTRKKA